MAELKYVDWDGLVYYDGKIKQYIQDRDENYVKMGGIISFAELPDPTYYNLHYIYKITDEFTTNSRFEDEGWTYKPGTWVQCVDLHDDASRYRYIIFNEETIGGTADLTNYYTKSEVDKKIEDAIDAIVLPEDLSNYYTKDEVDALIPDDFATQSDIEIINKSVADVQTSFDELQNITRDLTAEVEALKEDVQSIPTKVSELENDKGYLTDDDLSVKNFATEQFVKDEIVKAELNGGEITEEDLEQFLSNYYKKSETYSRDEIDAKIPDVSKFVTKDEIPSIEGLATEEYVDNKINELNIPESELFVVDYNNPDFSAAFDAYKNGKLLLLTNAAPDVNSYAIVNYVREDMITFTKFLMSRSTAYGAFNTYYLSSDNTWEVAKEVKLNVVEANTSAENTTELTTIKIGKQVYTLPKIDLSNYYTKAEVNDIIPEVPTKVSELENDAGYLTEHQDLSEYAKKTDIPSHEDFVTKDALEEVTQDVSALNKSTVKQRYEILTVPGLGIIYRDDEIRLNTEHIELKQQDVGEGGESNAYYIGIRIYAPENAHSIRQNVTSAPGIQDGKEIVPFTDSDIDAYGRKYSNAWVKCAIYQNGNWTNYGLSSTADKCLGYYYTVEWFDSNGNIIENDTIHVVFTNDSCHYSNISDAVSRRFIDVKSSINNIEQNYVTNQTLESNYVSNTYITQNYSTTEQIEATYVTNEQVTEVVTNEVNTVVTEQIEIKVNEVIQEKVDAGEIIVESAESIKYATWD